MFDISSTITTYNTYDLLVVLVLGVIGGLLGALYNFLLDRTLRVYSIINEYDPLLFLNVLCDQFTPFPLRCSAMVKLCAIASLRVGWSSNYSDTLAC